MIESHAPEPLCPITGAAPQRWVQWLSKGMLVDLWRYSFRVDVSDQVSDIERFGIWESPTGLLYFDPPRGGDGDFYRRFYGRIGAHDRLSGPRILRSEFVRAASHVVPGTRVLDVGCGEGGFRRYLSSCEYLGLDPNFGGRRPDIRAETIEAHAAQNSSHYDAVCSFQVVEHVPDPLGFRARYGRRVAARRAAPDRRPLLALTGNRHPELRDQCSAPSSDFVDRVRLAGALRAVGPRLPRHRTDPGQRACNPNLLDEALRTEIQFGPPVPECLVVASRPALVLPGGPVRRSLSCTASLGSCDRTPDGRTEIVMPERRGNAPGRLLPRP